MLRRILLTYKQNRFETLGTVIVSALFAALALYVAWQLNSVVFPKDCSPTQNGYMTFDSSGQPMFQEPTRACQAAIDQFNTIRNGMLSALIQTGLILAPFGLAILLGAPLVAREIEQNTAPLSWSLIGSRRRWLAVRVAAILGIFVPAMIAVGLAGDILYGAENPGTSPWGSFADYGLRGAPVVFWALAAFMGTMALGTLFGRALPAIFIALVVCLFARVGGEYYFQQIVLEPYAQPLMTVEQMNTGYYSWDPTNLTTGWENYLDGKPFTGDVNEWYLTNTPPPELIQPVPAPTPETSVAPDSSASPGVAASPDPNAKPAPVDFGMPIVWGPQSMPIGFHGDQYWPVVTAEAGILLAGSVLLASIAFFWVGRRRPY
jgi:hypothetical protein